MRASLPWIRTSSFGSALVASFLMLPALSLAQGAPAGPLGPKPGAGPEALPHKPDLRVRVREVTAPVAVRDPRGEMVLSLTPKDFHVYDNGAEQKIEHFDLGGDRLSIVLAIETSSRIEALLPALRRTGIVFSQAVMAQSAEAAVVGFDDSVNMLERFTTDPDSIESAFGHLREGGSGALLYDAMARGIRLLGERPKAWRRILVVLAEAQDTGSESKLGEVLRNAQLDNVTVYSIALSTTAAAFRSKPHPTATAPIGPPGTFPLPTPEGRPQTPELEQQLEQNADLLALAVWLVKTGANALGPNSLSLASRATGGLHLKVMKDRSIEKALDAIGGELHAQYTLGYRPSDGGSAGYHEIKVEVNHPGVSVRTRPGYYVPPSE